jgi:peptide/nickel transport system permease protein
LEDRTAVGGLIVVVIFVLAAVLAVVAAPAPYDQQNLPERILPPAWIDRGSVEHPLGTDQLGRDLLSRIMYGARISLLVSSISAGVACIVGTVLGLWSGYFGGLVDAVVMRLADAQLSFPYLLLAVAIMSIGERGLLKLIIVLSLGGWVTYARTVRASVLVLKQMEFVEAARTLGATTTRILFLHILPNLAGSIIVVGTFQFAQMILTESSLGFLGLGVQPPTPSWGGMLSQGRSYFSTAWWLVIFPGVTIMLAVLGTNLLGDGLRDALDPRLKTH